MINKIKATFLKQNARFEDLVGLKCRKEFAVAKVLASSGMLSCKNDCSSLCKFSGEFFFFSWLDFAPKQASINDHSSTVFYLGIQSKLVDDSECAKIWLKISNEDPKTIHMPNCRITITLGMNPFGSAFKITSTSIIKTFA